MHGGTTTAAAAKYCVTLTADVRARLLADLSLLKLVVLLVLLLLQLPNTVLYAQCL
jgi:hypothetical protein